VSKEESPLIKKLNNCFQVQLSSSIYLSTDNHTVVLQLQFKEKIFGYLKIANSEIGNKNINIELDGLQKFSKLNSLYVPKIIYKSVYNDNNYFICTDLGGEHSILDYKTLKHLTSLIFKSSKVEHALNRHPRIINLIKLSRQNGLASFETNVFSSINDKKLKYKEVLEHGDFTPWNVRLHNNKLALFDFEQFCGFGIEGFDIIKYYYSYYAHVKKYNPKTVLKKLSNILSRKEKNILILFFYKELMTAKHHELDCSLIETYIDLIS